MPSTPTRFWLLRFAAMLLAVAFAYGRTTSAEASILVPEESAWDLESPSDSGMNAPSTSSSSNGEHRGLPPSHAPVPGQSDDDYALFKHSSPNGSTSSSSSSSGMNFGAPTSVAIFTTPLAPQDNLCGWLRGEKQFSLPEPPGLDLLRPPRQA